MRTTMNSLLAAREALLTTRLFCIGYAWVDQTFGELEGSTVVDSIDGTVALRSFQSKNPRVTRAWLITPAAEENPFIERRAFLKKEAA